MRSNSLIQTFLLLTAFTIFSLGVVMIFSTTSAEILDLGLEKSTHLPIIKQMTYAFFGLLLAFFVYRMGYQSFLQYAPLFFFLFTLLLLLTLLPGTGRMVNGSRRWLNIPGLSFQPSEFVKYVVPAFFIFRFTEFKNGIDSFKTFIKLLFPFLFPVLLILLEPNNGTAAVIVITLVMLLFLTRIPLKYWAAPLLIFACLGGAFALQHPYVSARLKVYLQPELDVKGKGHQPHQAKIAAGSGGLWGKGAGNSWQKLSYLPEAQNDYIAAIFAEEFGFIGIMGLIVLYMFFAFLGFSVSFRAKSVRGMYLAATVTFLISFQAFLNLGVVSSLLPSTGLNLPLFSQGGSSIIANLIGLSLLCSIAKDQSNPLDCFRS